MAPRDQSRNIPKQLGSITGALIAAIVFAAGAHAQLPTRAPEVLPPNAKAPFTAQISCTTDGEGMQEKVCDANNACITRRSSCYPFVCENSTHTCTASCGTCAKNAVCTNGRCVMNTNQAPVCLGLAFSRNYSGETQSCAPYACGSDGGCRQTCTETSHCAMGFLCDTAHGTCVSPQGSVPANALPPKGAQRVVLPDTGITTQPITAITASCGANDTVEEKLCDAKGTCTTVRHSCYPQACDPSTKSCFARCTDGGPGCASGLTCKNNVCLR